MTDDLVIGLRKRRDQGSKMAAARIEQDAATIARLERERDEMESEAHAHIEMWGKALREKAAAEAKVAALVEALRDLFGAVCGDTGFAQYVRDHSGMAYPWPALDLAEERARAAIAAAKGGA